MGAVVQHGLNGDDQSGCAQRGIGAAACCECAVGGLALQRRFGRTNDLRKAHNVMDNFSASLLTIAPGTP